MSETIKDERHLGGFWCVKWAFWTWEKVFQCLRCTTSISKCICVHQIRFLPTRHTVVSLTGLPEAEPNERISIWQQWILNCALTDGWIRGDRAPFQQDLRCDSECLRRGRCRGKKKRAPESEKYGCRDGATSLQLYEKKPVMSSHRFVKASEYYGRTLMVRRQFIKFRRLVRRQLSLLSRSCDHKLGTLQ